MQTQAEGWGEPAGVRDAAGRASGTHEDAGAHARCGIGVRSDIPVRRYGSVPPPDDEPVWEQIDRGRPRSIAESGGAAVLLVALATAAVVGLLVYLR
ncbi:hypothetical protein JJB11_00380 [Ramlibacter ginsenosidimutans]|uniref:Uncharacterized protein n=1 Tax=Ramlibacter ginsenosidimutans TaxID=502333 RepID=A0A934TNX2_9BURK|nr:hypothetical protein [Ramlibacter ginsenosidimutans]MBK6004530.1 hypothetical protein [Ramlibacter ginsenosidimutans]